VSTKGGPAPDTGDNPYSGVGGTSSGSGVSFSGADRGSLCTALDAVTARGDAMVFSRTSDGGAVSIRVLHDKLVTKWYCKDIAELDDLLHGLSAVR
jgi:hypothetical protein